MMVNGLAEFLRKMPTEPVKFPLEGSVDRSVLGRPPASAESPHVGFPCLQPRGDSTGLDFPGDPATTAHRRGNAPPAKGQTATSNLT